MANIVVVSGNMVRDPETKTIPSGQSVCSFAIASNRRWTDRQSGEKKEEVSFIDCEAWGKTADLVMQYMKKGRPCLVEGRLKQDRWQTQEGQNRSRLKVVADRVEFLGGKTDGSGAGGGEGAGAPAGAPQNDADDIPF